jgi:hypothetical protein
MFPELRSAKELPSWVSKSKSKLLYDWRSVGHKNKCKFQTAPFRQVQVPEWCRAHSGICDRILLPVGRVQSEICSPVSVGLPLGWEDASAACIAITQRSESRRTHSHILLSHLRLPQHWGLGSHIYIPQEQSSPVIPLGAGFPFCHLLRLAGLMAEVF